MFLFFDILVAHYKESPVTNDLGILNIFSSLQRII